MTASRLKLSVARSDGVWDTALNLVKFADDRSLPYYLNGGTISIFSKMSLQEIVKVMSAGLGAKVEVYQDPDGETTAVFIYNDSFMWASNIDTGSHSLRWHSGGAAGTSSVTNLITQRLLECREEQEEVEGHYTIVVHEFFTEQKDNGTRGLTNARHFLHTKDKLLGLMHETYPYLDITSMTKAFLGGHENLFMLYGDPGVGKTCLMKILLRETAMLTKSGFHAIYVKDKEVLRRPEFWAQLIGMSRATTILAPEDLEDFDKDDDGDDSPTLGQGSDSCTYLILDDLDNELSARTKEKDNFIVSQMLSFADGLFENHLKIIITSNQELADIDKAIIRPGRCFDVMHLRALTYQEATDLWVNSLQLTLEDFQGSFPNPEMSISQAALISECGRVRDLRATRHYLLDPTVSVRRALLQS